MNIYERIKELRIKNGMSQYDLALKVGYEGRSAISKVEQGKRDISQSMIFKYAEALGVSPAYLLYGEEEQEKILTDPERKLATFFERFENLCKEIKKTPSGVGAELGVSKATVSYWRHNSNAIPKSEQLQKIAAYLGVSTDYLIGTTDIRSSKTLISDEDLKVALFGGDSEVTDEMWNEVVNFARYVKEQRSKKL